MNVNLLLSSISKQISLTADETAFFTSLLRSKKLAAGELLLREGQVCRYESFITRGCFRTYYADAAGDEHTIDFLIEEWWASDLYSLFTQTPSRYHIRAMEESEILQISRHNLEILYRRAPKFERFFRLLFQNAYIAQREQMNAALSTRAEERYRLFLEKKPYAEKRFQQKHIASWLGITPQFLSRLRKKMKR